MQHAVTQQQVHLPLQPSQWTGCQNNLNSPTKHLETQKKNLFVKLSLGACLQRHDFWKKRAKYFR